MSWIADSKGAITEAAKNVALYGTLFLIGIGATYIVIKNPSVLGKWARLPLDAAKGTTKFIGGSIKTGTDAVLAVPRAIGVVKD